MFVYDGSGGGGDHSYFSVTLYDQPILFLFNIIFDFVNNNVTWYLNYIFVIGFHNCLDIHKNISPTWLHDEKKVELDLIKYKSSSYYESYKVHSYNREVGLL